MYPSATRVTSMRTRFLGASICMTLMSSAAQAALVSHTASFLNATDSEKVFSLTLTTFASGMPIYGVATTRLDAAFAFADGARDGVTFSLAGEPGGFATGKVGSATDTDNLATVLGSGSTQGFAGAGGSGGEVFIGSHGGKAIGALPSSFSFTDATNIGAIPSSADRVLSVATAGTFSDGDLANGGSIALHGAPTTATRTLLRGGTTAGSAGAGAAATFQPHVDVYQLASASMSGIDCGGGCDLLETAAFTLTSDDSFALLARAEVGREAPGGPVTWVYLPGPQLGTYDCGASGCDAFQLAISFRLSAHDAVSLSSRFEVLPQVAADAPDSLALLGVGLLSLVTLRRSSGRAHMGFVGQDACSPIRPSRPERADLKEPT